MNFSEIDGPGRMLAVFGSALHDADQWVRIGAAQALVKLVPERAEEVLDRYFASLERNSPEQWLAVLALNALPSDQIPRIANLIDVRPDVLRSELKAPYRDFSRTLDERFTRIPQASHRVGSEVFLSAWRKQSTAANVMSSMETVDAKVAQRARPEYSNAASAISLALLTAGSFFPENHNDMEAVFNPIIEGLRDVELSRREQAVNALVRVALCHRSTSYRHASRQALKEIGMDAAAIVVPTLLGSPPFVPTADDINGLREERFVLNRISEDEVRSEAFRRSWALWNAVEVLSELRDWDSVELIVAIAIGSDREASANACAVLGQQSIDTALPPLFWNAANHPSYLIRSRAKLILDGILSKKGLYETDFHRVSDKAIKADLTWILGLLERSLELPGWAVTVEYAGTLAWSRDRDATLELLRNALQMVPLLEGSLVVAYFDSASLDKVQGFIRRIGGHRDAPSIERILRYPDAAFPASVAFNSTVPLTFRLGLEPPEGHPVRGEPVVELSIPSGKADIDLLAIVTANGFDVQPQYRQLRVPATGPSESVQFELTARTVGPQNIEIALFLATERVGYTVLFTEVLDTVANAERARCVVVEATSDEELLRRGTTRSVLHVSWNRSGFLEFSVFDPRSAGRPARMLGSSQHPVTAESAKTVIDRQAEIALDVLQHEYSPADLAAVKSDIAALGYGLFQQLAPEGLREEVQRWPRDSVIAVESDADWVPWELLSEAPGAGVWADRFQIVRIPMIPKPNPEWANLLVPLDAVTIDGTCVRRVLSVIGDEIPAELTNGTDILGLMAPNVVRELEGADFSTLKSAIAEADIVHFTCHGRSKPTYHLSLGPGVAHRLLPDRVPELVLKPGAVVFANACSSGAPALFLKEFSSFGFKFYAKGARPFIGTLAPVPTKHAVLFARRFYSWFITKGMPVGLAIRQARADVDRERGNPLSLFYCVYGPASASRRL